ncbi:ribose-5-phosphate isomerase RpiA [Natrialbaceae archaeon AArc-T1-2]|uniref:ribose-5-phosphate isomerase RpiA n=1 Tax=Natrialbaceae archaeon AArc-T1-2 TaxID=3053904 RepID=UPI00255AD78F|nr:ribose-5-phosphate isomerase RpiA [Natrialbaceae archaeon AArc-T1-2]WIV67650.1 ribose-5-phosphate isomerase RpiA [Natrialbaceae archaeon AArc-T1-2]
MKSNGGSDAAKRRAGERAAEDVEDGDVVGLGTGSTTAHAIRALGRGVEDGLEIRGIPTSYQSRRLAIDVGVPLTTLEEVDGIDLAIDGADQIADGDLIKGGGAAHAREKVVDAAAERFVVVADPSKLADRLERAVPVEVLPDARPVVERRVRELGGEPALRAAERKDGPVVTDNGNLVLDCEFGEIDDPDALATRLSAIPGILEHGLFVDLVNATYVGTEGGVERRTY